MKLISKNKKADFEYFFSDSVEAGVVLTGAEVKSVKLGHANINDAFCLIRGGECWLKNAFVASYEKGSAFNPEERRDRKLLLHRDEIDRLEGKINRKGFTLVPRKIYFKDNKVKVEIGVAEGKKLHDKRQTIKDRDIKRDAEREIKNYK
ncbi:SsrA-binding protein SmpB [Anaerocaecibacter muris]|uniref:SsrA-binding protein SmpB n=1 Tax=Anaerocaecibacter muris TaxID=2941513 RepID=UPI003F6949D7